MPYRSAKQRRYMHAKHPEIAARWDEEYGGEVEPSGGEKSEKNKKKKAHIQRRAMKEGK